MKYDILESFKEYLKENLRPNTAKTYYAAVVKLFRDSQFDSLKQIDKEWTLQETAKRFTTRNEYSAVKNGLKWLKKYNPDLALPSEKEFCAISIRKRNFSRKPKKVIYLQPTQRKINQISNDRLRYAYRLALVSGLRVSELADLEADDITFNAGKILVRVKNGKGGHGGLVECRDDAYLYERLPEFLKKYPEGKVFYTECYMREKADELGIECHDLRRIFAQTTREELKKEMPVAVANEIVQQRLRHVRFSTTKRYLFNRKLKFEYEEADEAEEKQKSTGHEGKETEKNENSIVWNIKSSYKEITNLDKKKFGKYGNEMLTDEVILMTERVQHIIQGRGHDFYNRYSSHIKEIIDTPDYIFEDKEPNTVLVTKQIMEDDKVVNIVVRLAVRGDNPEYKNSIITMIGMGRKRFKQYLNKCTKENKIIYKKE